MNTNQYQERITKGLCGTCQRPSATATCEKCKKKQNTRREGRRSNGLCPRCGERAETGYKQCKKCRDKANEFKKQKNKNGKCSYCSNNAAIGHTICQSCLDKERVRRRNHLWETYAKNYLGDTNRSQELKDILNKQNGKCAYSGLPITIGVNASLDHIIPKSKGGSNDVTNLQWTTKYVNKMKSDMEAQEFISLCRLIVENHPL